MQSLLDNKALMVGAGLFALLVGVLLLLAIVQMLFRGKLRLPGGRTRQARLGIVDAFDLDRQRQLIIVRRDNTEHLIMIGGPNDLLIEAEISRVDSRESRRDKFEAVAPGLAAGQGFTEPRILAPYAPVPERLEPQTRLPDVAAPVRSAPVPLAGATPVAGPVTKPFTVSAPAVSPVEPAVDTPPQRSEPARSETARSEPPVTPPAPLPPSPQNPPAAAPQAGLPRADAEKRAPAFPLPPRRPLATAEPRPAPRPPENEKRSDPQTPPADAAVPPSTGTAAAPAAPARVPPQFLRPLPPRPALKIGLRPGTGPASPPLSQPAPAVSAPDAHGETLESLEEEMAKLLGRGAGEN